MKRLLIIIVILCYSIAQAQEPHEVVFTISDIANYHNNELTFCDFDSITGVIVKKDPSFNGTVFWIDEQNYVLQADSITIRPENDGHLLYIEKENDSLIGVNIWILQNEMPEPTLDTVWLHEGMKYDPEPITLQPTEENLGYTYVWESENWSQDSLYQGFELEVGNAGFYRCNMWDQCLHYSKAEFFVEKAPVIGYVSTNLNLNLNELHWTPKGSTYDTIAIYRNGYIVTIEDKHTGIWVDPVYNNEGGTPWYVMYAIQNGRIIEESASRWMCGISLGIQNTTSETVDLSFYGPDNEMGYQMEEYIQFFQLYSVETNGFGLVRSMIPVGTTELLDIENDYDTLIVAAVLWNGIEVYSNMVFPHAGITKCEENNENDISIYPNPTDGILKFSTSIDAEYKIFDIQGRIVKNGNIQPQLNVSDLAKGMYTIQICENGKKPFTKKFIKE